MIATRSASQVDPSCRPVVATIAAVFRDGKVLLVRRANPPDAGHWGFSGGKIEHGETILGAAVRELFEETEITGEAVRVFTAVDALDHDDNGNVRHHYVLVVVLCRYVSGTAVAGDDALETRWFSPDELDDTDLALSLDVARQAAALTDVECP
ncbi:NUDIX hydrolase [Breoghania sp.]|uniref:NUDIX hydrolase n=1 Tax=Breoghania sp. TaxID=2065378 RepID=UPI002623E3DC|nr:NUDIX hydrolase [Breoghania sp.]MDJ0931250.1 NUDIX hydrolase [Breoghania sp.]